MILKERSLINRKWVFTVAIVLTLLIASIGTVVAYAANSEKVLTENVSTEGIGESSRLMKVRTIFLILIMKQLLQTRLLLSSNNIGGYQFDI